ncbi:hypothetical protein BPOR_0234g00130 [Botrytis porri]|uniref:Uncharacterized protein n=1 Tax=Botrytis porri TaxID=87229 RepID=A0A4Z1KML0_9HELO|nr:hypothetical protein BPOR_0234g00130 [Botrytis porri]
MFLHLFNLIGTTQLGELVLEPPVCESEEYKTIYWDSAEESIEPWQRVAKRLSIKIKTTAEYDEDGDPESSDSNS